MEREELKEEIRDYIMENSLTSLNGIISEICHEVAKDIEGLEKNWWLEKEKLYKSLS